MPRNGSGSRGRARRNVDLESRARYDPETELINVLDLERKLDIRLTTEERWALEAMFGAPTNSLSDEDKRKARKVVKALTRELAQCNFGKRLVFASMQEEIPIEKQAALLPYALPKAPTEVELMVRKEDMTDEQVQARIDELLGNAKQVIDVSNS